MKMERDYDLEFQTSMDFVSRQSFRYAGTDYFRDALGDLVRVMQGFHREIDIAKQSGELTENGMRNLRIKTARKTLGELKARQEKVSVLDNRIRDINSTMKPKPKNMEDKLITYLMHKEIRDSLKGLDPLEVKALYLQATESDGFEEVAEAIESAPALPGRAPMLPKRDIEEGRRIRLERENPEAAREIKELSAIKSVINSFLLPSIKEIETVLGESEDPLAKAAGAKIAGAKDERGSVQFIK
jgi:hypothetical protein